MPTFTAVFQRDGNWWVGWVEELPGANAQERTLDEARESLKEAARDIIAANREIAQQASIGREVIREALDISAA